MEIILLQDVDNLGYKDDIVKVKAGYARNYLIPKKLAIVANASNRKSVEEKKRQQQAKYEKMLAELNAVADTLKAEAIRVGAKAGTSGKIFGSVTTLQIAEAIRQSTGVEVDRKKIKILEEVKTLGKYKATVELHREVIPEIEFEVVAE